MGLNSREDRLEERAAKVWAVGWGWQQWMVRDGESHHPMGTTEPCVDWLVELQPSQNSRQPQWGSRCRVWGYYGPQPGTYIISSATLFSSLQPSPLTSSLWSHVRTVSLVECTAASPSLSKKGLGYPCPPKAPELGPQFYSFT